MKKYMQVLCTLSLVLVAAYFFCHPVFAEANVKAPASITVPSTPASPAAAPVAPHAPVSDSGSTAWVLISTILVLMMTIPGLALFYGGMMHKESVLATLMQSFVTTALISVLWVTYGYSLVFTEHSGFIGGMSKFMLNGVRVSSVYGTEPAIIPEMLYMMFQMTFAIITCALIFGAVANRINFAAGLVFVGTWFTLVYCPVAHWVWGPKGMLGGTGMPQYMGISGLGHVIDFAGGTVVEINSGIAGLMAAVVLGHRKNFGAHEAPPYNIVFSVIGASLLWVGWFGFNAGSAIAAGGSAAMAMVNTHIAGAIASLTWMGVEWYQRGKPSVIGIISGAVAGMVAITPACGFVDLGGSIIIGLVSGLACYWACGLKFKFWYDDSLDVFGIHAVGGIVGLLLTGLLAVQDMGGITGNFLQFSAQCEGAAITIVYCGIMSYFILKVIDVTMGLRVDAATEREGLDFAIHGNQLHT